MKVKNLGIVLLFYCWNNSGKAQNLIPNNSFETFLQCPTQADQGPAAVPWGSGNTYIFPELFNSCATLSSIVSVPVNADSMLGYQWPHSGNGYAGINVYQDTNPFPIDYGTGAWRSCETEAPRNIGPLRQLMLALVLRPVPLSSPACKAIEPETPPNTGDA